MTLVFIGEFRRIYPRVRTAPYSAKTKIDEIRHCFEPRPRYIATK